MKKLLLAAAIAVFAVGCSSTEEVEPGNPVDTVGVAIEAAVNIIVIPSVNTLHSKGDDLADKMSIFKANPTDANLAAAKSAWVEVRAAWEITEGYGFGPEGDVDPNVDDWPLNTAGLASILASSATLDAAFVASMETNTKGFHSIEYLLYGANGAKAIGAFTPRELELLSAMAEDISENLHGLAQEWNTGGGNYGDNLLHTGGTSLYDSRTTVLNELGQGLVDCSGEVGSEKIKLPLETMDENLDESQYSKNSVNDFVNNITGVRNMYLGTTNGTSGNGLTAIIRSVRSSLDDSIKTAINTALAKIQAMTPTFVDAIHNTPTVVKDAQLATEELSAILADQMMPILATQK